MPRFRFSLKVWFRTKDSTVLLISKILEEVQTVTSSIHTSMDHFYGARAKVEQVRQGLLDDIAFQSDKL